jgi:Skp family chaperone for outer membrane proteins
MKVFRMCLCLAVAVSLCATTVQAKQKIGFINITRVFESTNEGKAILKRLQTEHTKKQKELDTRMKAFEEKAKQFQQQSVMLNDSVKQERLQTLAKEERELQALFMQYQQGINKKKTEALQAFEGKVMAIVQTVAKKEKLDFIFRQEVLLHGPTKMDLTNQVIREYDKLYPGKKSK